MNMKYCSQCGEPLRLGIPEGDNRQRHICDACSTVHYHNPKIVTGCIATWEDSVLLCRRAIEPRKGFWTLPAGFLELNETAADGAAREAAEEANARLRIGPLLAVYNIPRISQVQLIYIADLLSPDVAPGAESLEVRLFAWDDLPWAETAFPSVRWALDDYRAVRGKAAFGPRTNPPGDMGNYKPGPPPADIARKAT